MANYHRIKAHLYDNVLTDNPNDFVARVSSERMLTVRSISQEAVARGGADISVAAMEHAVELWLREMAYNLCDGYSVNTGWFTASAHIRGVFNSPIEQFSPDRHSVLFEFHQGATLRKEIETVEVQILGVADVGLLIAQVTDIKTGSINDLVTPGRNLRIAGIKIKIAGDHPDNGIFFVSADTAARVKVDEALVGNNPSEVMIFTPSLAPGVWKLEIVTQFSGSGGKTLKEPRRTVFDHDLTVQ
jgi:hypothetical protein